VSLPLVTVKEEKVSIDDRLEREGGKTKWVNKLLARKKKWHYLKIVSKALQLLRRKYVGQRIRGWKKRVTIEVWLILHP